MIPKILGHGRTLLAIAIFILVPNLTWAQSATLQFASSVVEVQESAGFATVEVLRSGNASGIVSVQYRTGSTNTELGEYVPTYGTLVWGDGETGAKTFSVTVRDDTTKENTEYAFLHIETPTGAAVLGNPSKARLLILDDDADQSTISLVRRNFEVAESAGTAQIEVKRTGSGAGVASVQYRTGNTNTTLGEYVPAYGTLTWEDGELGNKTFEVQIVDDNRREGNEYTEVIIETPTGGALLGKLNRGKLYILDDDGFDARLSFAASRFDAAESAEFADIGVQRTGNSSGIVSVQYRTGSTNTDLGEYVPVYGVLNWADGELGTKVFTVEFNDDAVAEADEFTHLFIESPTGSAKLAAPSESKLYFIDDDAPLDDRDQDGVPNRDDTCANTPAGAATDAAGCSEEQLAEQSRPHGTGVLGVVARLFANLNDAVSSLLSGDFGGAAAAVEFALTEFVAQVSALGDDAESPGQLIGLQAEPDEALAQTLSAERRAEPVVMKGHLLASWSVPAAEGTALPHPDGAFIGERSAHNGTLIYPGPGVDAVPGAPVENIAAYRREGDQWVEIPVQVDEMMPYFLANPNSDFAIYSGTDEELSYVWDVEAWDPQGNAPAATYPAATQDPVPGLDNDDEVVFMADDAGELYTGTDYPGDWEAVQQVTLVDPLDPANLRFVYLVQKIGGSSFTAQNGYVRAERAADADEWIDRYSFCRDDPEVLGVSNTGYGANLSGDVHRTANGCSNPEGPQSSVVDGSPRASSDRTPRDGLVVTTANYRWEASGRWMVRDLRVRRPGDVVDGSYDWSSRPDLIDRWKGRAFQQSPDSNVSVVGFEDEQVNWEMNSTLLGWRSGPVRSLREVWGADSGTNVTKTEAFYRDAITYRYHVRVHPIPSDGLYTSWDYNRNAMIPSAAELANGVQPGRYYTQLRPQGVPIDGVNDDLGNVDSLGGMPAFFDVADASFNLMTGFYNWEQVSGKGDLGSLVYLFEIKGATSVGNPLVVPYYRDDACLDDGTGDDPVARPWPGETSTDSRVVNGYQDLNGNGSIDCEERQGAHGAHGVHYFFTHDSDNAFSGQTTTEIDGQQWQFIVPSDQPQNLGEPYANIVRIPLVATAAPLGGAGEDSDGDGFADADDNCPNEPNADQADLDGDGSGDACDSDVDGDGVDNDDDRYPSDASESADSDGDLIGDNADTDDDNDGVDDNADNCPLVANDQSDIDGDSLGDACDDDIDGDNVANAADNCATVANNGQIDMDGDGIGDACQTTIACPDFGTNVVAEWTGQVEAAAEPAVQAESDIVPFSIPTNCDIVSATVKIAWDNQVEDLDLYVVGHAGQTGGESANANIIGSATESVNLVLPNGGYEAQIVPYTNGNTAYVGTITLVRSGGAAACADGIDNDGDGKIDLAGDPGCSDASDNDEGGDAPTACDIAYDGFGELGSNLLPVIPVDLPADLLFTFADDAGRDAAATHLARGDLLSESELESLHVFRNLPILTYRSDLVTAELLNQLQSQLQGYRLGSITHNHAVPLTLDESLAYIEADHAQRLLDVTGKGIGVAIIDSGIDTTQGDFANVRDNRKFVGTVGVETPYGDTTSGHGTHVAGTVGGTGASSDGRWAGVAPEATLLGYGSGDGDSILILSAVAGYERMLDPEIMSLYNPRVTNNSYGGAGDFSPSDPIMVAVRRAYLHGITSVFATGNDGADSLSSYAGPCSISVANGTKDGELSSTSSRAAAGASRVPTITAPGTNITAPRAMTGFAATTIPEPTNPRYSTISGTSMASPHVAGVVALMLEKSPGLQLEEIVEIFEDTARPMPGYLPHQVGFGYIDALAAVAAAQGVPEPDPNSGGPDEDICTAPGATVVTDYANDYDPSGTGIAGIGGNDNQDFLSAHIAQPFAADGNQLLEIRLQIASLEQLQPGSAYFLTYRDAASSSGFSGVRMEVATDLSTAFFSYVAGASNGGTSDGRFVDSKTPISGSYDAQTGEILFLVSPGDLGLDPADINQNTLSGFLAGISQTDPANVAALVFVPDSAPDDLTRTGSYTVKPNAFCDSTGDSDNDNVANNIDNCPADPNPLQEDFNSDGEGDACDTDIDGDGHDNAQDAFDYDPSEWSDNDGDGTGDNADNDDDNDGYDDGVDNCPRVANDQTDSDNNGIGDACDVPPAPACSDGIDNDGDGWVDGLDAGCSGPGDDDESDLGLTQCSDGIDNNDPEDTLADSADPDCANGADDDEAAPVVSNDQRVVVAVIDSAINPYHDFYYANGTVITESILDELGVPAANRNIALTRSGNMAQDLIADAAFWSSVNWGEMYHFAGTNIVAASFAGNNGNDQPHPPLRPEWYGDNDPRNKSPHGTGTSSSVLAANPEAVILFIETDGALGNDNAVELAYRNPAVDIVSTSYGIAIQGTVGVIPEARSFHDTYNGVVNNGKLHFTSAGNNPGLTPLTAGAGPWWSIGVGGVEEDNFDLVGALAGDENENDGAGQQIMAGNLPDFVGDYSQPLPYCMDCQSDINPSVPGTSFSTPRAAGTASKVLLEARRASGHSGGIDTSGTAPLMVSAGGKQISNWVLRRALEEAAWVPEVTDHSSGNQIIWESTTLPVNPVAPWLQVGWGGLTPDPAKGVVSAALAHLGYTGTMRIKAPGFCEFQTELVLARHSYWDDIAPQVPFVINNTENIGHTGTDPFVYCRSLNPLHPASNDPGQIDSDGDGVNDAADNCVDDSNPDQADSNLNGIGNACDTVTSTDCPLPNGPHVVEWDGTIGPSAIIAGPTGEHTQLISLPANCSYDAASVAISYEVATAEDLDLEVTKPGGAVENSLTSEVGGETLTLTPPIDSGDYSVRTFGFTSISTDYHGVFSANVTGSTGGGGGGPDADNDGIADATDNCVNDPNPLQTDTDNDGVGDACDSDLDGDGVDNVQDVFPYDSTEWEDSDSDGIGDNSDPFPNDPNNGNTVTPRVVVAVIDSGINPYHEFYYSGSRIYPAGSPPSSVTQEVLDEFGISGDCVISDMTKNHAVDTTAPLGVLYKARNCDYVHFAGTNLLATSADAGSIRFFPDDNADDVHGVGTSAAVLVANPEAILLFVEGTGAGEAVTFTHPAVDIVSTSYGPQGSAPIPFALEEGFDGVYRRGKLHFGACDNSPSTAQQDSTCGAWWAIGVAGYEETQANEPGAGFGDGGRQIMSGSFPDFIADYTQTLPYCQFCTSGEDDYVGGTSFATPRSAGTASKILLQARRLVGHSGGPVVTDEADPVSTPPLLIAGTDQQGNSVAITNWEIRRALEESAWLPGIADYDPFEGLFALGLPINDAAPWLQTGWGVLSPVAGDVVGQTLAHLGLVTAPGGTLRTKSGNHCDFQMLNIDARKAYWDNLAIGSDTWLSPPSDDPYIRCDTSAE